MILFPQLKLFIVRIPQHKAIQPKATTLGGAFIFHMLNKGLGQVDLLEITEKKKDWEHTILRGPPNTTILSSFRSESLRKNI